MACCRSMCRNSVSNAVLSVAKVVIAFWVDGRLMSRRMTSTRCGLNLCRLTEARRGSRPSRMTRVNYGLYRRRLTNSCRDMSPPGMTSASTVPFVIMSGA
jgi:hypothetical protein